MMKYFVGKVYLFYELLSDIDIVVDILWYM